MYWYNNFSTANYLYPEITVGVLKVSCRVNYRSSHDKSLSTSIETTKSWKPLPTLTFVPQTKPPENFESVNVDLNFFQKLNWNKLPGKASIRFLSLTIALLIVGLSNSAFALVLKTGNSGSQVATLQKDLATAGFYKGPVTGYYGSITTSAVTKFQRSNGITPDGVAGDMTLAALQARGGF